MKKILAILLASGIVIYISYKNLDHEIIENKIYTTDIDFSTIKNQSIVFDDTKIIEKSKEILTAIYGDLDFSQFKIETNSSLDNNVYAYFTNNEKDGYIVNFDVNEGALIGLSKLIKNKNTTFTSYKSVEELEEISMENIKKLQVDDLENYKYNTYEIYNNIIILKYRNEKINKSISTMLDIESGEFLEYSYYQLLSYPPLSYPAISHQSTIEGVLSPQ